MQNDFRNLYSMALHVVNLNAYLRLYTCKHKIMFHDIIMSVYDIVWFFLFEELLSVLYCCCFPYFCSSLIALSLTFIVPFNFRIDKGIIHAYEGVLVITPSL